jgi:hypothetical protein
MRTRLSWGTLMFFPAADRKEMLFAQLYETYLFAAAT